jgi:hypothetical protein
MASFNISRFSSEVRIISGLLCGNKESASVNNPSIVSSRFILSVPNMNDMYLEANFSHICLFMTGHLRSKSGPSDKVEIISGMQFFWFFSFFIRNTAHYFLENDELRVATRPATIYNYLRVGSDLGVLVSVPRLRILTPCP